MLQRTIMVNIWVGAVKLSIKSFVSCVVAQLFLVYYA